MRRILKRLLPTLLIFISQATLANFKDRDCETTPEKFGAKSDGKTDATQALRAAIQACSRVKLTGHYLIQERIDIPSYTHIFGVLRDELEEYAEAGIPQTFAPLIEQPLTFRTTINQIQTDLRGHIYEASEDKTIEFLLMVRTPAIDGLSKLRILIRKNGLDYSRTLRQVS